MDSITQLLEIDYAAVFISICTLLIAFKTLSSLFEWFVKKWGLETKQMRTRREEHDLLIATANGLNDLSKKHEEDVSQSIRHDDMIRQDLKKLTDLFIDKEIEDMRWEIINFSAKVSEGKRCNKDGYNHCIRTYEKYEKLLEAHGLENGAVSLSMEVVNESYKDKLKNGF